MVPQMIIEEIVKEIERQNLANALADWPARVQPAPKLESQGDGESDSLKHAFPKSEVPIIVPDAEARLTTKVMTWGYHVSWSKQVVFNTRFDTATRPGRNMWAESLAERRCVVPTYGFYEPHKSETFINPRSGKPNKQQYYFTSPSSAILFIAGVFEGDQFSLMTTEPNATMLPIHNRMPVVLQPKELDTWLFGEYLSLEDRSAVDLIATKQAR